MRLRQKNDDLLAANADLEAFCHSVSHDLRMPLRHIHSYISILEASASQQAQFGGTASCEHRAESSTAHDATDRRFAGVLAHRPRRHASTAHSHDRADRRNIPGPGAGSDQSSHRLAAARDSRHGGRSAVAETGVGEPARQRGEVHPAARSGEESRSAPKRPTTKSSTTSKTTASASTCSTPIVCSACSSACTRKRISKARASAWRTSGASCNGTAAAPGPKASKAAARRFTSRCHRRQRLRSAPALQRALEIGGRAGFGNVVVHAGIEAAFPILAHGVGGERDDRQVTARVELAAANGASRLEAVHFRHLAIHEHQIVVLRAAVRSQAMRPFSAIVHFAAELLQQARGEHAIDGVIFDDQHAQRMSPTLSTQAAAAVAGPMSAPGSCRWLRRVVRTAA